MFIVPVVAQLTHGRGEYYLLRKIRCAIVGKVSRVADKSIAVACTRYSLPETIIEDYLSDT